LKSTSNKTEIFNALTFSELIFQLLTPKILTDFSRLILAHGFSRGEKKILASYSFPPLKRWAMGEELYQRASLTVLVLIGWG
jgi:hypothetical protein